MARHANAGPLWVKRRNPGLTSARLLCAQEETWRSFDHLVSASEQRRWYGETERFGRFLIDRQIEFRRDLNRKIGGLCAMQNAIRVPCEVPVEFTHVWSVCHQQSLLGKRKPARDGRQLGFQRELGNPVAHLVHRRIRKDHQRVTTILKNGAK